MKKRILSTLSKKTNLELLHEEAQQQWASIVAVNEVEVGGNLYPAFYFPESAEVTQADVDALVSAHDAASLSSGQQALSDRAARRASLKAALDAGTLSATHLGNIVRELLGE